MRRNINIYYTNSPLSGTIFITYTPSNKSGYCRSIIERICECCGMQLRSSPYEREYKEKMRALHSDII
jgi:hypothetical protein